MKIEQEWRTRRVEEEERAMDEGTEKQGARVAVKEMGLSADNEGAKEEEEEQWVANEE